MQGRGQGNGQGRRKGTGVAAPMSKGGPALDPGQEAQKRLLGTVSKL